MSNWATRGKAAINAVNLKPVGGGSSDPIKTFYNHAAPKSGVLKDNQKVISNGQEFNGTYEGSFETQGKFGPSTQHKIRTEEGLISLPGSGQLNKRLGQVEIKSPVYVKYTGKQAMQDGKFAGTLAHTYEVAAEKLKSELA